MKILAAIAVGGAIGAAGRYGLSVAWPAAEGGFPWAIFVVNVSGCLLIGVLMAFEPPLMTRLFLGTGVLGGYTTFSAYTLDFERLIAAARPDLAFAYLFGTLVAALIAVQTGGWLTRAVRRR